MLEKIDLSKSIRKEEYEELEDELQVRLGELQRKAWKMGIPIIVVFEGWHASGMTEIVNNFLLSLNPMGFELHTTGKPCPREEQKPLIWRFWTKIPPKGKIAIFDRSWYRRALLEHLQGNMPEEYTVKCLGRLSYFERQLADDGYLIIKLFLHVSREKQEERFGEMQKKDIPLILIKGEDYDIIPDYEKYLPLAERMLEKTDIPSAPWTIVESDDTNFASIKVMQAFAMAAEGKIRAIEEANPSAYTQGNDAYSGALSSSILQTVDLSKSMSREEYKEMKKRYQKELDELQYELFRQGKSLIIVFEGWDASGKGGSIRRMAQILNPRLYKVIPVGAPSDVELAHHYLWRFYNQIPDAGHIAIFDRSWYGRVLVERVECLCQEQQWRRAFREINEFEEVLADHGTIIIKFWLHIGRDEQLQRFREREKTPHKQWKITADDWNNREKWDMYETAADEMLQRTSTTYAPWTIIGANDKSYSRIKVLSTVVETMKKELKSGN